MTIRAMLGFAHLPKKDSYGVAATGYGLALAGAGITFTTDFAGNQCWVDDNNALYIVNLADARTCTVTIPFTGLTDFTSPKTVLGFRYTLPAGMRGDSTMTIGGVTTGFQEIGLPTAPSTSYVELVCDRVTKEISYFVNGEFKLKKVSTVVPIAAGQAMSFTTSRYGNAAMALKDFYFIDDTQDDTPCTRLGPVTVKAIDVNSALAPDWVASNAAAPLDVINTPYTTTASITAPVLSSPESLATMELGLAGLANAGDNVKAVMFAVASRRLPSSAVGIDLGIKLDDVTLVGATARYIGDAITYGNSGVFTKLPDGSAWTADKLKTIKLTLKPKPV